MSSLNGNDAGVSSHPSSDSGARPKNGGGSQKSDPVHSAVSRAVALATGLDEQVRERPYVVLGIACVVGAVAGVILSNRVLRGVVSATARSAAVELTRTFIRQALANG